MNQVSTTVEDTVMKSPTTETNNTNESDNTNNNASKKKFFGFTFFNKSPTKSPTEKPSNALSPFNGGNKIPNALSPTNNAKKIKLIEKDVKTLMALGFPRAECEIALTDNYNDVQKAAMLLISSK